jgi:hypothetical protein
MAKARNKDKELAKELSVVEAAKASVTKISKLTKAQEALISVLQRPESAMLTVDDICKLSSITRATYYNCFRNDNFVRALEMEYQAYRNSQEFAILHTNIEKAKEGKSHHWAKMFWEMQGRLSAANRKPAQIIVNFNVQRPKVDVEVAENVIEVQAEPVE